VSDELRFRLLELRGELQELEKVLADSEAPPAEPPTEPATLRGPSAVPHFAVIREMGLGFLVGHPIGARCTRCGVVISRHEPDADETVTAHLALCS
jgi:hypothetical protein